MAKVRAENISNVNGNVNVAGRDIINNIQTIERALTAGEVIEKDMQIEINELTRGLRGYLDRLKQQVAGGASSVPYKGLESYVLPDAQVFFGRNKSIQDLRQAMKRSSLTILQAESGAGKTSLLQAGIIPSLINEQNLAILIRPQFENPTLTIKNCLIENLESTPKLARTPLVNFLRQVSGIIGYQTTLYLVLDQFEEFFAKRTSEEDRQAFISDLAECLNDATLNVRWVISITSDALGRIGKFEPYIRMPFSNVQSLYLFTHQEAAEVVARTAQYHGLSFEDGLLDRILNDLGHQRNDPIAPTHIQLVCAALYSDIEDKSSVFTQAQYDEMNGAQGILQGYIDRVLRHNMPLEERGVAYRILEALVTSEKKRILRTKSDLDADLRSRGIAPEVLDATLDHLVAGRLLRRHGDDPHHIQYEIVHDYLLAEIEIDEATIRIKQAEELVEDGLKAWRRNRNFLLTNEHLIFIENDMHGTELILNEEKAEFLLLSAAVNYRRIVPWIGAISDEKIQAITSLAIRELASKDREARKKAKAIAWTLRAYLPAGTYRRLLFAKVLSKTWVLIPIFLILGLSLPSIRFWLLTPEFSRWEALPRFEDQTHANLEHMIVALDLDNPDDVYVSDRTPGVLFISGDGGGHWRKISTNGMQDTVLQLSLVVENRLYALTKEAIWISSDQGQNWDKTAGIKLSETEELMSLAVNPRNAAQIFAGSNSGKLYHTLDYGESWQEMPQGAYGGKQIQALATNGNVLIVATEEGLWVNTIENNQWETVSLAGCTEHGDPADRVAALAIPYPLDDPPEVTDGIGFWAAVSDVGICDSDTKNAYGNTLYYASANSLSSIAATGDVILETHVYLATGDGIIRYRTWFYDNWEWWKIKIQSRLP